MSNKTGINKWSKKVIADYYDKKGHPLRPLAYRLTKASGGLIRIPDVMYCPKCNLFYRLTVKEVKVVI